MMVQTSLLKEELEVEQRLQQLQLDRKLLLEVRDVARAAANSSTTFHTANASGTYAYIEGTWALRDRFVGPDWEMDRSEGVEAIFNKGLMLRVAFSNVDVAANHFRHPKPRSPKGAGAERICEGNLFGDALPSYAPIEQGGVATYYMMVDERGAAELSRPVIQASTFIACIERIFLSDGLDAALDNLAPENDDRADDFDPMVIAR
ncbi:hypothetical protein [Agrobacterium tumefaciens]|uniref:hypothetical protein n=1 Tax=Agrobacterium tumefaciens TaxID=358 RepID=UPI00046FC34F